MFNNIKYQKIINYLKTPPQIVFLYQNSNIILIVLKLVLYSQSIFI